MDQTRDRNLLEVVRAMRPIGYYSGEPVSQDVVDAILSVARYAPSYWGGDPVEFILVRDKVTLESLSASKSMGTGSLRFSEVCIIPVIDTTISKMWMEDLAVVSGYIMLAAEYYGVGCNRVRMEGRLGIHSTPEHPVTAAEDVATLLGIPEHYRLLDVLSLGGKRRNLGDRELTLKGCVHDEKF